MSHIADDGNQNRQDKPASSETLHLDEDAARMLRALDSLGGNRQGQGFAVPAAASPKDRPQNGHRFGSGGEMVVTVAHHGRNDGREHRSSPGSTVDRLAAAETALNSERALREQVQGRLAQAEAKVCELQTRLAHTELAHREALEAAESKISAAREEIDQIRTKLRASEDAQQQASGDARAQRRARQQAEAALELERGTCEGLRRKLRRAQANSQPNGARKPAKRTAGRKLASAGVRKTAPPTSGRNGEAIKNTRKPTAIKKPMTRSKRRRRLPREIEKPSPRAPR